MWKSEDLLVRRLVEHAKLPTWGTNVAAGLDLYACLDAPLRITRGNYTLVPTGIAIKIPQNYVGLVCPRSGLAINEGISVLNSPGVIDEDYTGEMKVILINHGPKRIKIGDPNAHAYSYDAGFEINHGDRIAQLVVVPRLPFAIRIVDELPKTDRGANGFGSTGK
jgi:dUTP pyrophosphatase